MEVGAVYQGGNRCVFTVWAPFARSVEAVFHSPRQGSLPLRAVGDGYWREAGEAPPGTLYTLRLDGEEDRPDPASRHQPGDVHGPSQVVDPAYAWSDGRWRNLPLEDYVFYELHVGTFSPRGDFAGVEEKLAHLAELGVTAVELMPVAQFPGRRNWGYDGVLPYAVQNSYGGAGGLKRLVNACHGRGLAVVLDVVYNHLGPEGNYLRRFGPYFTSRHQTDWGEAVNLDDALSHGVRNFCLENALYWFREFHVDALRLDAVHALKDDSPRHFLRELSERTESLARELERPLYLIAESDQNDVRLVTPRAQGGMGMDAQWSDDLHHCLHTLLTGEGKGYYRDFGRMKQLAKAFNEPFVYSGQFSPSRKRNVGTVSLGQPGRRFVVCSQNHDQVGNRMLGERLPRLVPFEALKLAAGTVLLSPYLPLLFMGEEYGETAPFLYFVSHSDPALVEAIRNGRREEFRAFAWQGEFPDPQDEGTFLRSRLDWELHRKEPHAALLRFYRELIGLRKAHPELSARPERNLRVTYDEAERWLAWEKRENQAAWKAVMNFAPEDRRIPASSLFPEGRLGSAAWKARIDAGRPEWGGDRPLPDELDPREPLVLPGYRFALYRREAG